MPMSRFAVRSLAITAVAGLATVLPVQTASAADNEYPPLENPLLEIPREVGGIVGENQEGAVAGVIDITREITDLLVPIFE